MRLFLDTEYDGFGGELISMALVPEEVLPWLGEYFYEVLAVPTQPGDFVREHVLPKLLKDPIGQDRFDSRLLAFVHQHEGCEIIADWPADFEHLCASMTRLGRSVGWRCPVEFTMRLVNTPELKPKTPHNALSDACALRDWWVASRQGT